MTNRNTAISATVILLAIVLIAVPFIANSLTRSQMTETLNNFRQLQVAMQTMLLDLYTSGAELQRDVESALVEGNYLTRSDLKMITDGYQMEYFPLSEPSPSPETVMIIARGESRKIIVTYGAGGRIERLK